MMVSHKATVCFLARFAAFVAVATAFLGVCAALPRAARAQTVFDGEKRARYNETVYRYSEEISGRVLLDDGKPAVGFVVKAEFSHGHSMTEGEGTAITDAQGNYRIHGLYSLLEPFLVQVENTDTGYLVGPAHLIHVHLFPKGKAGNVNFTLRRGPRITVRVRDAETGEPVAGVIVQSADPTTANRRPIGRTKTNGDFVFHADDLRFNLFLNEDTLWIQKRAVAPGYFFYKEIRLQNSTDTFVEIKTYKNPLSFPAATFRGVVLDEKNKPVSGAKVCLVRFGEPSETTSDTNGRFLFHSKRIESVETSKKRTTVITAEKGNHRAELVPTAEQTWGTVQVRLLETQTSTPAGK